MALHARDLIDEMVETRKNPLASYMERLRNLAAVRKLKRKYGSAILREVLIALGEIPGFPPAQLLWNASHTQIPLHCFIRMRQEPVFRIVKMDVSPMKITVRVEYGENSKTEDDPRNRCPASGSLFPARIDGAQGRGRDFVRLIGFHYNRVDVRGGLSLGSADVPLFSGAEAKKLGTRGPGGDVFVVWFQNLGVFCW